MCGVAALILITIHIVIMGGMQAMGAPACILAVGQGLWLVVDIALREGMGERVGAVLREEVGVALLVGVGEALEVAECDIYIERRKDQASAVHITKYEAIRGTAFKRRSLQTLWSRRSSSSSASGFDEGLSKLASTFAHSAHFERGGPRDRSTSTAHKLTNNVWPHRGAVDLVPSSKL